MRIRSFEKAILYNALCGWKFRLGFIFVLAYTRMDYEVNTECDWYKIKNKNPE